MPEAARPNTLPNPLELIEAIDSFTDARVLIFGDVMLDEYLNGEAERISPEAPVPVIRVENDSILAGGAGNVARNMRSLGARPVLVGVCGRDIAGTRLTQSLRSEDIDIRLLELPGRETTVKTRILARQQQVLRVDREDSGPLSAAQVDKLLQKAEEALAHCAAVLVSDYGKGAVCKRSMEGLVSLAARRAVPVLVDPKPRNFRLYKGVTLLTPNAKETGESVNMPVADKRGIVRAGRAIMKRLGCPQLITTLGGRGMAVFDGPQCIRHIPTMARQVFDVTGAGDTVISTLALGLVAGLPLVSAALLANYAAGIVVGRVGAAAVSPNQLAEAIATLPCPEVENWG